MKPMTCEEIASYWHHRYQCEAEEANRLRDALRKIAREQGDPQRIAWEALGDDEEDDDAT